MLSFKRFLIPICVSSFLFFSCTYPFPTSTLNIPQRVEVSAPSENAGTEMAEAENVQGTGNETSTKIVIIDPDEGVTHPQVAQNEPAIEEETNDTEDKTSTVTDQEKMDEAISLLEQSQALWEKGELNSALELLDEAYTLVLDVDGEPEISWQKDDLRYLIAKRILEIYTSRSTVAKGSQSEIPLILNADIEKEIKCFQGPERNFLIASYKRSGAYRPYMVKKLKEAGLPEELSWLPLVESGFKINALSRARALGLWQFIPSTGYKFGLNRDTYVDERMDVEKSTKAAIDYLKELHGIFGDWLTVLAAYNCGEGRVLNVISRQHMNYLDNFWDLYRQLPYETARYVPRFLASVIIIKNPEKYGFDLSGGLERPIAFEKTKIKKRLKLADIAREMSISSDILEELNTELRYKTTPDYEYALKIPAGSTEKVGPAIERLRTVEQPGGPVFVRHRVKSGETLSGLARRYRTSINAIVAANNLSSKHSIRAGRWLKIPSKGYVASASAVSSSSARASGETLKGGKYVVKKGDSLWMLARRFGTTVSEIKSANRLRNNNLKIGQVLRIGEEEKAGPAKISVAQATKTYTVQKGDSLYTIARKHNIKLDDLLGRNGLTETSVIYPGQVLVLQ